MALADEAWTPISLHEVALAWLRADRGKAYAKKSWAEFPLPEGAPSLAKLLDQPSLTDAEENRARLRLLYLLRNALLVEIPPDTRWYRVRHLRSEALDELYVFNHRNWLSLDDRNEVAKVGARMRITLDGPPSAWPQPILIGHARKGPFAIMDGNHRLSAYAASGQTGLEVPVLVGLSPLRCIWNVNDGYGEDPLMRDLLG